MHHNSTDARVQLLRKSWIAYHLHIPTIVAVTQTQVSAHRYAHANSATRLRRSIFGPRQSAVTLKDVTTVSWASLRVWFYFGGRWQLVYGELPPPAGLECDYSWLVSYCHLLDWSVTTVWLYAPLYFFKSVPWLFCFVINLVVVYVWMNEDILQYLNKYEDNI